MVRRFYQTPMKVPGILSFMKWALWWLPFLASVQASSFLRIFWGNDGKKGTEKSSGSPPAPKKMVTIDLMAYDVLTAPKDSKPKGFTVNTSFIFWSLIRYADSAIAVGTEPIGLVEDFPEWYRTIFELSILLRKAGVTVSWPYDLTSEAIDDPIVDCFWGLQQWIVCVDPENLADRSQKVLRIAKETSHPTFLVPMLFGPYTGDRQALEEAIKGNSSLSYLLGDPLVKYLLSLRGKGNEGPFWSAWLPNVVDSFDKTFPPALNPMCFQPGKVIQSCEPSAFSELDRVIHKHIKGQSRARTVCNFTMDLELSDLKNVSIFPGGMGLEMCLQTLEGKGKPELIIWIKPENDHYARVLREDEQVSEIVEELPVKYGGAYPSVGNDIEPPESAFLTEAFLRHKNDYFTLRFDPARQVWTYYSWRIPEKVVSIPTYFAHQQIKKHAIYLFYSFRSKSSASK
jgi:hypothetical protein